MSIFKEYNPSKRTFTRVQSTSPPPETCDINPPEARPPSLPSTAIRHASNALLALGDYVSNVFQQFTTSVSRPSRSIRLSLDDPLSPSGLSFSSASSSPCYNRQTTLPDRQSTPSYNRQITLSNRQSTPPYNRQTTPDNASFESDTHIPPSPLNAHDGDSDTYDLPPPVNTDDISSPLDENITTRIPKKRGRKVNSTFPLPPYGELQHPYIDWVRVATE